MKHRTLALILFFLLLFGLTSGAAAQANYQFQLTQEVVQVYLNADGSMALDYLLTFVNSPGAHAIDFVDLGLPNSNYNFDTISADIDGQPLTVSTNYQGNGTGVAIELGSKQFTDTGIVHVSVGQITDIVYPDDNDKNYASSEFSPNYFDSQFVQGLTDLTVVLHLPPGVKPEEPRYHPARGDWPGAAEPASGFDADGRITYTWRSLDANASTEYIFGASFPKQYIPETAIVTTTFLDTIVGWIGTLAGMLPFCCFGLIFVGIPLLSVISDRNRKLQYIKPTIAIEGHGIKRGLTAVEAAILMGQPLDKVMTMILFSTVKKGALRVVTREPLVVEQLVPQPQGLQVYEQSFVAAMVEKESPRRKGLQAMSIDLVKSVTEKMKGFSQKETLEYYKAINEKAWQQINAEGTPEIKSKMFEEALEWTMLDKNYDDRARRTFSGPVFVPMWWGRYDPLYRQPSIPGGVTSGTPSFPSSSSGGQVSLPGADFAASVVGGVQNFSGRVLGNLNDFTNGVTKVTNPPPPPSSSSGGRSGGGSCACACACAGCACACAGGGR